MMSPGGLGAWLYSRSILVQYIALYVSFCRVNRKHDSVKKHVQYCTVPEDTEEGISCPGVVGVP